MEWAICADINTARGGSLRHCSKLSSPNVLLSRTLKGDSCLIDGQPPALGSVASPSTSQFATRGVFRGYAAVASGEKFACCCATIRLLWADVIAISPGLGEYFKGEWCL